MNKNDQNLTIISNENDAIDLLTQILNNPNTTDISQIKICGWNEFTLHISGEKFDNSITPTVMRGIIELQQAIYEAYALAKYQEKNVKRLTKLEKDKLELIVVITAGSSFIKIDVNEPLNNALQQALSQMNSEQIVCIIIVALLAYFGRSVWVRHLEKAQAIKEQELENERHKIIADSMLEQTKVLSEQNSRVVAVLEEAVQKIPYAQDVVQTAHETRNRVMRSLKNTDTTEINGAILVSGASAEFYTQPQVEVWQPVRLDGDYRILNVDSSDTRQRKVTLRHLATYEKMIATLEDNTLDKRHTEALGVAEWGLHPIFLKIKAKMKHDKYKEVEIIDIQEVKTHIVFDDEENND